MKGLMRKMIGRTFAAACFLLALAFGTAGCARTTTGSEAETDASDITMTALVEANDVETIHSRHTSMLLEYRISDSDEVVWEYADADYIYQMLDGTDVLVGKEDVWQCDEQDGEKTFYYYWYAMDEKEEAEMRITPSDYPLPIDNPYTIRETIESVQENEDGTLTVITWSNAEDTKEYLESQQVECPEGAEQRTEYVVDRETLELVSVSSAVVVDGADALASTLNITYDVDQPEALKALAAQIEELKSGERTNERTITVIYDYGTDAEESYEIKADQSYRVIPVTRAGYDYLYSDPEKTEVFEGSDVLSDVIVYVFTEE